MMKLILSICFIVLGTAAFAQYDDEPNTYQPFGEWDLGLNFGMYWPAKYHAQFYNGREENVNKISLIFENQYRWDEMNAVINSADTFFVSELPTNMRYTAAFQIGIYLRKTFDNYLGFSMQFDYSKLTASDKFTVEVDPDYILTEPDIRIYDIWGVEERVNIDLLISKYFKLDNPMFIPFFEGGLNISSTKVKEHMIRVENIEYSLVDERLGQGYVPGAAQNTYEIYQGGMGLGFSAAVGVKMMFNDQISIDPGFRVYFQKIKLEGYELMKPSFSIFVRLSLADFFSTYE